MKKSKIRTVLILLIIMALCLSVGVYAGYTLSATEVSYTKSDGTTISIKQALDELNTKAAGSVSVSTSTTHTATELTSNCSWSWDELSTAAKMISNNSSITSDTAEVNVTLNGVTKTLGIGDTATVDGKKVRILGFNHDTLTSSTAYGEATATGKAGISFEYVELLTTAQMNSSDTNSGGWGSCALKTTLNGTTYSGLSIKDKIKQVQKEYIKIYANASSKTTSSDYLWLLSCGEIWDNGYNGGETRGCAIATEGSQYKYYKSTLGSTTYSSSSDIIKKPNVTTASKWWLRSPRYDNYRGYCFVYPEGTIGADTANSFFGIAPGFCI